MERQFFSLKMMDHIEHYYLHSNKQKMMSWAVVVAQLVERSLPIPEVRGSNPVIGKNLY